MYLAVKAHPSSTDFVEKFFVENLKKHSTLSESNNGFLILGLLEIGKGKDNYDLVKEVFDTNRVDKFVVSDLEGFEIEVGMRTERETPKPDPLASIRKKLEVYKENSSKNNKPSLREKLSKTGRKKINLKKLKKKKK